MKRISSVDAFRGIAMLLMPLDHVHDFFSRIVLTNTLFELSWQEYIQRVSAMLVPVYFSLICGMGIYFSSRGQAFSKEQSIRLIKRGLFCILFGTIVLYPLFFLEPVIVFGPLEQLGLAMIVIAVLLRIRKGWMIVVMAATLIGNAVLDFFPRLSSELWIKLMHVEFRAILFSDTTYFNVYPFLPWIGVMIAGYYLGMFVKSASGEKRRSYWLLAAAGFALFLILRWFNLADPNTWYPQHTLATTIKDFFALTKYPPSIDLLLFTLSTAFAILGTFHNRNNRLIDVLEVYGRVPMFFYIVHIVLARIMASVWLSVFHMPRLQMMGSVVVTTILLVILYPICRWYYGVKTANRGKAWADYI